MTENIYCSKLHYFRLNVSIKTNKTKICNCRFCLTCIDKYYSGINQSQFISATKLFDLRLANAGTAAIIGWLYINHIDGLTAAKVLSSGLARLMLSKAPLGICGNPCMRLWSLARTIYTYHNGALTGSVILQAKLLSEDRGSTGTNIWPAL